MSSRILLIFLLPTLFFASSCTSPRSQFESGRVTPYGSTVAGGQMVVNVGSAPAAKIADAIAIPADDLNLLFERNDTLSAEEAARLKTQVAQLGEGVVAYACDPSGVGVVWYARYGFAPRLDAGYKYISGSHTIDGRYQFLGPTAIGKKGTPTNSGNRWFGSIGLQLTTQGIGSPSWLKVFSDQISFDFRRTDIIVPLTMSYSFGRDEEYGGIAIGVCYSQANLKYQTQSDIVLQALNEQGIAERIEVRDIQGKSVARGMGGYITLKVGYKRVFLTPSLNVFYHDFGDFQNMLGDDFHLSGWSIIPSMGLRFVIR